MNKTSLQPTESEKALRQAQWDQAQAALSKNTLAERWANVKADKRDVADALYSGIHALLQKAGLETTQNGKFSRPVERALVGLITIVTSRLKS